MQKVRLGCFFALRLIGAEGYTNINALMLEKPESCEHKPFTAKSKEWMQNTGVLVSHDFYVFGYFFAVTWYKNIFISKPLVAVRNGFRFCLKVTVSYCLKGLGLFSPTKGISQVSVEEALILPKEERHEFVSCRWKRKPLELCSEDMGHRIETFHLSLNNTRNAIFSGLRSRRIRDSKPRHVIGVITLAPCTKCVESQSKVKLQLGQYQKAEPVRSSPEKNQFHTCHLETNLATLAKILERTIMPRRSPDMFAGFWGMGAKQM